ncbi:helix-turn-helix transcriptional regulator [Dietzia sp. SL131]|uniref:helix-turn-helix domain-containing protein n=1 Tax=Dietzia sp. SL131 TaxID=2995149 RepID=UPI00227C85BD|nr:helix-turn-helix transcriptional regulator [Dietzia sp. SL131]MCY1659257.1 helix-turn-helix transcriptional regulator [Dietzia sp. SL131]
MQDDADLLEEFGRRLRHQRTAIGLSQEELAHRCGMHRTYVSSVERGERNIALLNIVSLATALGTDASTFVAGLSRGP